MTPPRSFEYARAVPRPTLRFVDDVVQLTVPPVTVRGASGHGRPALSIESCPPWIRVALEGVSLGWARPAPSWQSLIWIGEGRRQSLEVIPPIQKKELGQRSWPAFFARALSVSKHSPLSAGAWELSALHARTTAPNLRARDEVFPSASLPSTQPRHAPFRANGLLHSVHAPSARVLPWVRSDAPNVVALRTASAPDAARVKSWRKEARAGTLPPALLLWVSSMAGYLVLDGHDRALAASLEHTPLGAVALYTYRSPRSLYFHVKYRDSDAAEKGLMMPALSDITEKDAEYLWAFLRVLAEKPLRPYRPAVTLP